MLAVFLPARLDSAVLYLLQTKRPLVNKKLSKTPMKASFKKKEKSFCFCQSRESILFNGETFFIVVLGAAHS